MNGKGSRFSNSRTSVSPYMHGIDEISCEKAAQKDLTTITKFIGSLRFGMTLDIGEENPLKLLLEKHYQQEIDSTSIDLYVGKLEGIYDTVLCFEVVEHLFNPLHMLLEIRKVLKDDGTLFLSTPKRRPHCMWYKHHFHEFSKRELLDLLERAGFSIVRIEYHRSGRPILGYFRGIRSFLRLFIERKCILELKKG